MLRVELKHLGKTGSHGYRRPGAGQDTDKHGDGKTFQRPPSHHPQRDDRHQGSTTGHHSAGKCRLHSPVIDLGYRQARFRSQSLSDPVSYDD